MFLWNDFFETFGGIPIGDPFLYWAMENGPSDNCIKTPEINCFPRFDDSLSSSNRITNYLSFVRNVVDTNGFDTNISLYLHPSESETVVQSIRNEIRKRNLKIVLKSEKSVLNRQIEIVKGSKLVSNYYGAHVFRASLLNIDVDLVMTKEPSQVKNIKNPVIRDLLSTYYASEKISHRREVSEVMLGIKHMRLREELKELLGWKNTKKLLGRPVRFLYQGYQKVVL